MQARHTNIIINIKGSLVTSPSAALKTELMTRPITYMQPSTRQELLRPTRSRGAGGASTDMRLPEVDSKALANEHRQDKGE